MAATLKRWTEEALQAMGRPEEGEMFFFCSLNAAAASPEELFLSPVWEQVFGATKKTASCASGGDDLTWQCNSLAREGETMPEFTTVSVKEAQLRTIPGRQGKFINEYADYIQQLAIGQAGRLTAGESENPLTIRRRLVSAAKAMNIPLTIKRSGNDMYFWRENGGDEQPRRKRSYTRRNKRQEETAEQYFGETGELELGEIRQTESAAPDQAFSEPEYPAEDKYPGMTVPFEPDLPNSKE